MCIQNVYVIVIIIIYNFCDIFMQVTLYGKIPVFGVYIRMFAAVAVNILKCLFTYLGLLFAFSLTLHFLFRKQKEFDSVGFTFLKVHNFFGTFVWQDNVHQLCIIIYKYLNGLKSVISTDIFLFLDFCHDDRGD